MPDKVSSKSTDQITNLIRSFKLNEPIEDTKQDVILKLFESGYLDRFDESRGVSFTTYIYTVVKNCCITKSNKTRSKGGLLIEYAKQIRFGSDKEDLVVNEIFEETIPSKSKNISEYNDLVEKIRAILIKIPNSSSSLYNGKTVERSLLNVFNLLEFGFVVKDIAEIFSTSTQHIYSQIKLIRDILSKNNITENDFK